MGHVDGDCETNALRIAQEALSNVRNHAQAKSVMVTLIFGPSEVLVRVMDDGIGFDPAAVQGIPSTAGTGFGLSGMRERAGLVGGSLLLRSASGMGTTIEARIPYQSGSGPGITTHNKEASMATPVL